MRQVRSNLNNRWAPTPVVITSLLHIACQLCDEDIIRLILDRGANPSPFSSIGWTPLHMVAWSGKVSIMRLLLGAGADPNLIQPADQQSRFTADLARTTPFHQAVIGGHVSAVDILLEAGADAHALHPRCDALGLATIYQDTGMLQHLVNTGLYGRESMIRAFSLSDKHEGVLTLKILLDGGVDTQLCLPRAVTANRPDYVELLINAGADPRKSSELLSHVLNLKVLQLILAKAPGLSAEALPTPFAHSPLELLYENVNRRFNSDNLEEMAVLLINDGCPIQQDPMNNVRQMAPIYILCEAASWGHARVIKAILPSVKAYLNQKANRDSNTPLHYATLSAHKNKLACVKLLVEHGADLHAKNLIGQTPFECLFTRNILWLARVKGEHLQDDAEVTQYFIDSGIDVNARFHTDMTTEPPLFHALASGNDLAALVIINAGANIYVRAENGWSAFQLAAWSGCFKALERLLQEDNIQSLLEYQSEDTLLHFAVQGGLALHKKVDGYGKMMAHLLLGHVDVSVADVVVSKHHEGELKPLAHTGCMEVIRRICSKGIVDPGARNQRGFTPFDVIIYQKGCPKFIYNHKKKHKAEIAALIGEANQKWPKPQKR
ncbi:hypothetical protein B7463_g3578, partial [Scytalidium lignicola]